MKVYLTDNRRYLKIKVKHLAAEAAIIRKEENKVHGMDKWRLQHHRKTVLRDAARQTQIAYAIVRGKTLNQTLGSDYSEKYYDRKPVVNMVRKYGSDEQRADAEKATRDWFDGVVEVPDRHPSMMAA